MNNKIITDNEFITSLTFDCAENYDKYYEMSIQTGVVHEGYMETMFELMDHRCLITVKSWAHQSEYENEIWTTAWEDFSYLNQVYLDEIPCEDEKCKKLKENVNAMKTIMEMQRDARK